ncbi:MAG: MarR family winged helix-turn-helix transcriptional regulator [Holophaga sp.]|nr:MarR family winged helix-turn-helix transcriptional regulator [Holophaga sp.]
MLPTYPKPPSACHCLNTRRASRAITQFYEDYLEPCALTLAQLSLLRQTAGLEGGTIHQLAERMRIDRTTLNRNLKPLQEAGLVGIEAGSDCRTRQVRLTPAGEAALTRGWALWGEAQEALKAYLGQDDLNALETLLAKLEALAP